MRFQAAIYNYASSGCKAKEIALVNA